MYNKHIAWDIKIFHTFESYTEFSSNSSSRRSKFLKIKQHLRLNRRPAKLLIGLLILALPGVTTSNLCFHTNFSHKSRKSNRILYFPKPPITREKLIFQNLPYASMSEIFFARVFKLVGKQLWRAILFVNQRHVSS